MSRWKVTSRKEVIQLCNLLQTVPKSKKRRGVGSVEMGREVEGRTGSSKGRKDSHSVVPDGLGTRHLLEERSYREGVTKGETGRLYDVCLLKKKSIDLKSLRNLLIRGRERTT